MKNSSYIFKLAAPVDMWINAFEEYVRERGEIGSNDNKVEIHVVDVLIHTPSYFCLSFYFHLT